MRLFTPLRPNPDAALPRANPTIKLGAAALLMLALFVSTDALTAGIVLGGLAAATLFSGLPSRALLARTWPLLLAALTVGILNTLLAPQQSGATLRIGPLVIGSDNAVTGIGLGLRLMGIAYSGVLALATTDPTDLADSLIQQLRFSPRFAVGALAGARLLPILADEWQILSLARRARGVQAGRSPIAAVRLLFGQLLGLLVAAVRRATRLATAMESRGFGALACRTIARPLAVGRGDWLLLAGAAGLGVVAIVVSVALGTWRFILG
jgi:energy-coupling factor transport system permease protein